MIEIICIRGSIFQILKILIYCDEIIKHYHIVSGCQILLVKFFILFKRITYQFPYQWQFTHKHLKPDILVKCHVAFRFEIIVMHHLKATTDNKRSRSAKRGNWVDVRQPIFFFYFCVQPTYISIIMKSGILLLLVVFFVVES